MKIIIGNDHGAVEIKNRIVRFLKSKGHSVTNKGIDTEDAVDYPDVAKEVCGEYLKGSYDFGILCCGTGIGISISANKILGIRCALVHDVFTAEMAKAHNNANFLAFGGRVLYTNSVESMLEAYISAQHEGDRHTRRVEKIMALDKKG